MQQAALDALALDARYQALDVPPAALPGAVAALRCDPWWGANVSVPHKETVVRWVDLLSPAAKRLGAVNTIVRCGAQLIGDNTDLVGFQHSLARLPWAVAQAPVVVLGAGGAARAVVAALHDLGAHITIANRNPERARALAAELAPDAHVLSDPDALAEAVRGAQLLVQTTTVGMHGGPPGSPLPLGVLPRQGAVIDLIYRPLRTPLLEAAEAAGLVLQNGLPMLVAQGAAALTLWTGRAAPVALMQQAAAAALAREH